MTSLAIITSSLLAISLWYNLRQAKQNGEDREALRRCEIDVKKYEELEKIKRPTSTDDADSVYEKLPE